MEFNEAIKKTSKGNKNALAIRAIYDVVKPLCKTETDQFDGTTLWDWLCEGQYKMEDTPESLAEEWDTAGT